jgi:hypothetical protein
MPRFVKGLCDSGGWADAWRFSLAKAVGIRDPRENPWEKWENPWEKWGSTFNKYSRYTPCRFLNNLLGPPIGKMMGIWKYHVPSGKRTKNDGKIHHFKWINQLFRLGHFQ